jgi:hypothetical protein
MGKKITPPRPSQPPSSAAFSDAEMKAMIVARDSATRTTPAVVRDALLGQAIQIGDVTLPVIMLGHILLLEKIGSPFVSPERGVEPTNEQVTEALFVLNTPASTVQQLLRTGRHAFEDAVLTFATTKVRLHDMRAIGSALGAQLLAASSTVIGNDSPASSGEGTGAGSGSAEKKSVATPAPVTSPADLLPNRTG